MARRILKRKLKITNLKKLKTTQRTFTSLGQWALKQLSKKQKPLLFTPYPKHLSLNLPLHRKQLLSQLVASFSCLAAANLSQAAKQTYLSQGVTNQRFVSQPLPRNDNWDKSNKSNFYAMGSIETNQSKGQICTPNTTKLCKRGSQSFMPLGKVELSSPAQISDV